MQHVSSVEVPPLRACIMVDVEVMLTDTIGMLTSKLGETIRPTQQANAWYDHLFLPKTADGWRRARMVWIPAHVPKLEPGEERRS